MSIATFLNKFNALILNPLIGLLFTIAFVYAVYGVVKFLSLDAADSGRKEARNSILYGILGMVIMFSVYGIIKFILVTFGVSPTSVPYINGKLQ